MGKEIKLDTEKKFVIVTDKGFTSCQMEPEEVMGSLLFVYLKMWNEYCSDVELDVQEAGGKIMDLLSEMGAAEEYEEDEEECFEKIIQRLFAEEEDDGET